MSDSFDLQRFVDAQAAVYRQVIEELSHGLKRTHWMWFTFPQITGLGFSAMAQRFAIGSRAEAVAYLEHDLLGPRLLECTGLVLAASEKTITDILGSPDDMKFRSCMTLFDVVSQQEIFAEAIAAFYPDGKDRATLEILETSRRLIVIAAQRQGTRPQLTCSFRRDQTNRIKIVAARSLRNHHRGPRSPAQGCQVP
jgi:uncharacterized protein (DUF1810 family)